MNAIVLSRVAARHGGILPLTLTVVLIIAVLLTVSSERVLGVRRQEDVAGARMRAAYAAEAVCALHEDGLAQLLSSSGRSEYGFDSYMYCPLPNWGSEWFGDCAVRWRIDPLRPTTLAGDAWTVQPTTPGTHATRAITTGYVANDSLWSYRIAAEAYATHDAGSGYAATLDPTTTPYTRGADAAAPWRDARQRSACVRAVRDVVLRHRPLPSFAVFYAAFGDDGRCEVENPQHGTLSIVRPAMPAGSSGGWIHANDDVRIGSDALGAIELGSAAHPIAISSATRIVRLPRVADPVAGGVTIDGQTFTTADDSLGSAWMDGALSAMLLDQSKGVRPATTPAQAHAIGSLLNGTQSGQFPRLGAHAAEYYAEVGEGVPLYVDGTIDATGRLAPGSSYTIFPRPASSSCAALYYQNDPDAITPGCAAVVQTAPTSWPVYATGMTMFYTVVADGTTRDVFRRDPPYPWTGGTVSVATPTWPGFAGFNQQSPRLGDYAYAATESAAMETDPTWQRCGLSIIERSRLDLATLPPRPSPGSPGFAADMAAYLTARYVVTCDQARFAPVSLAPSGDISASFFAYQAPGSAVASGLCATDDRFHDARHAEWLVQQGLIDASAQGLACVDVLTLHWSNVVAYLRDHRLAPSAANPKGPFNGIVYVRRAPLVVDGSLASADVAAPFGYHPVANPRPRLQLLAAADEIPGAWCAVSLVRHPSSPTYRGPRFVLPAHHAVRLADAADITYAAPGAYAGTEGEPSGLMLITPDHCYLQGDINRVAQTAAPAGEAQCVIVCDGATVLSNAWRDAAHQPGAALQPASDVTQRIALITANVPPPLVPPPASERSADSYGAGASNHGVAGVVTFLEDWTGRSWTLNGSLAVLSPQRYAPARCGVTAPATCVAPSMVLVYDANLLVRQSPAVVAPFASDLITGVSTVDLLP